MTGLDADEFVGLVVLAALLVVVLAVAGVGASGSAAPSASVDVSPAGHVDSGERCEATISVSLGEGDEQVDRVVVEVDQAGERSRVVGSSQGGDLRMVSQEFGMKIERGAPIRIYAITFDGSTDLLVDDRVTNFCTLAEGSA